MRLSGVFWVLVVVVVVDNDGGRHPKGNGQFDVHRYGRLLSILVFCSWII
jgi:hypothetical protein